MTTKTFFEYLLVSLILLWPIWALVFVFLGWLLKKHWLFLKSLKSEKAALSQRKRRPDSIGIEKMIGISHAPQSVK